VDLVKQWPHLQNAPYSESTICLGANELGDLATDLATDQKHIEFKPRNHMERIQFLDLLQNELRKRNLQMLGLALDAMCLTLNELLLIEQ
jgi:hypothetical protein